jgi:2-polyprenyl-6-methoxyphenol hydroxylase-like FAD-dependent oxidoreductase
MALENNLGLMAQRSSDSHIRTYVGMRTERCWYRDLGLDPRDTDAVRAALLAVFHDWAPALLALITDHDGDLVNRPLFALPVPHTWDHTEGVTLLGDAAHVMSPFSGMGANLAMLDGADLARAIADETTLDAAVRAYEAVMFPRSAEAAAGAAQGLAGAFSPDSAAHAVAHVTAHS